MRGLDISDDDALASIFRAAWPSMLVLALLDVGPMAAAPLGLFAADTTVPWPVPVSVALALGPPSRRARAPLHPRLRPLLVARAVAVGLGRDHQASEVTTDLLLWSAHLAERAIVEAAPRALAATCVLALVWVLSTLRIGAWLPLWVVFVALVALGVRLGARRWTRSLGEREGATRARTAAHLAAAARDGGELSAGAAREHLARSAVEAARAWEEAEARASAASLGARWVTATLAGGAIIIGIAVQHGLSSRWMSEGPPTLSGRDLRDVLLLLCALPVMLSGFRAIDEVLAAIELLRRAGAPKPAPAGTVTALRPVSDPDARLVASSLRFSFGEQVALSDVSFELPLRGVTAIVGSNGAGKSTLGRVLTGHLTPDRGTVTVDGHPIDDVHPERIALVPQQPVIVESMTILENVRLAAPAATEPEIVAVLTRLGASTVLDHPAGSLSRGEQRRIAIARALLRDPRLLVLDEPDAWLDRAGRETMASVLREEGQRRAILLITHRADLVRWVDRALVLRADHTLEMVGTPEELRDGSPTFEALLRDAADEALQLGAELGGAR